MTEATAAEAAITRTVDELGRLDTLVNAAGVMVNGPSEDSPLEEWDRMVDVNLRGLIYTTKAALPHLLRAASDTERSVADVVNISSVAGRLAAPQVALYNATKFAVTAATEAWRLEYTNRNLRFSVIEPGVSRPSCSPKRPVGKKVSSRPSVTSNRCMPRTSPRRSPSS